MFKTAIAVVVVIGAMTSSLTIAWAKADPASTASLAADVGARYRVLYASNAYVTDGKGGVRGGVDTGVVLEGQNITVDLGGKLILEVAGTASGNVQLLQNTKAVLGRDKILLAEGELVCQDLKKIKVDAEVFEAAASKPEGALSGYFFARGADAFVTVGPKSAVVDLTAPNSAPIKLKPLTSARIGQKRELKVHNIAPLGTLFAMKNLKGAIAYLKSEKKSVETIKIILAKRVEIASPTTKTPEFKRVKPGEKYVLQPEFAETLVRLKDNGSRLAVEYFDGKSRKTMNFSGKMTFSLYSQLKSEGGKS